MHIFILISFSTVPLFAGGNKEAPASLALEVYCYDSFSSEWGPGPSIIESFTEQTGIRVNLHAPGDAVTVLQRLIFEKAEPWADVVIGLDNSLLDTALAEGILEPYASPGLRNVPDHLVFDGSHHLLPYDYGHYAINYDTLFMENPPDSLEDLTAAEYKDQLILVDPRTSTPGLGFLLWTVTVYADEWPAYWKRLRPSILTIADGWSQAYALYTSQEAPMVLSYGTSPVYHVEYEGSGRYAALEFTDGHIMQIEGMGIINGTENRSAAEALIDFMLEKEAQGILALSNIMLPVRKDVPLPPSFDSVLRPAQILALPSGLEDTGQLIDRWVEVFTH